MSTVSIYELHCDGPGCDATAVVRKLSEMPDGWAALRSDAHLRDWKPGTRPPGRSGRTRADQRTVWDVHAGSFVLHLCPSHTEAFAGHEPRTEGGPMSRGDRRVAVGCSCGAGLGSAIDMTMIWSGRPGFEDEPRRTPERAWWRHLPTDLQEYAVRARRRAEEK
jgi:hypothetical protein